MRALALAKGEALGNDYLVVDARDLATARAASEPAVAADPAAPDPMTPALARALCDRHRGLGADGVLVGWPHVTPIRLRIWNPDGTGAEKSGNGLRIFGAWLHGRGVVGGEPFEVALPRDVVRLQVQGAAPGGGLVLSVAMGAADFEGRAVGFGPQSGLADQVALDLGEAGSALVNTVSLGNPHCVVLVDEFSRADFETRGPALATSPAFAEGTNVQFARALDRHTAEAWIWERGAGETLASGSSACAVAATLVRRGALDPGAITVRMPGGEVSVDVAGDFRLTLRGPARMVYEAVVAPGLVEAWVAGAMPA
ncbi:MAG TPA: diaminopimelate epimerase [Longimicrobiales bacterium]|nr:diaminopimelate epimerase [Longimicrobiales bacterium]